MALLEVTRLTTSVIRRSGAVPVVRDVTLTVDKGETLGIVGESGSGKSVTMLSVMGLIPTPPLKITEGSIVMNGRELVGADEATMQRVRGADMAMVYQDPMVSLNPVMKIGRQIEEGLNAHGVGRDDAEHRTLEVLEQVGIPDPPRIRDLYPHELSGGMRQRIMIASALALSPELLIFDEPTTALDVTIQQQILYLVRELQKSTGVAVVWITHDLGVLARLVDRVAVMYGGRVVEVDDIVTLFKEPHHPYTEALIASVPGMHDDERAPLQQIPGNPPEVGQMPTGCPFEPRCRYAIDRCATEMPPTVQHDTGQWACWVPREEWR
ncbi:MAG: ABC transporter ATP-binding protein [Actinomycetota bacterium]